MDHWVGKALRPQGVLWPVRGRTKPGSQLLPPCRWSPHRGSFAAVEKGRVGKEATSPRCVYCPGCRIAEKLDPAQVPRTKAVVLRKML